MLAWVIGLSLAFLFGVFKADWGYFRVTVFLAAPNHTKNIFPATHELYNI